MASFTHVHGTVSPQYGRVAKITVRVFVNDCTGTVYIAGRLPCLRLGRSCERDRVDTGR